jgi:hypothetical protein
MSGSYPVTLYLMANAASAGGLNHDHSLARLWPVLADMLQVDLKHGLVVSEVDERNVDPNYFSKFFVFHEHSEPEDWSVYCHLLTN